jgi:hypothetical protein
MALATLSLSLVSCLDGKDEVEFDLSFEELVVLLFGKKDMTGLDEEEEEEEEEEGIDEEEEVLSFLTKLNRCFSCE